MYTTITFSSGRYFNEDLILISVIDRFRLDLIKSVETVRKNHRNSLTGIRISQIMREAEKIIMDRQQRRE